MASREDKFLFDSKYDYQLITFSIQVYSAEVTLGHIKRIILELLVAATFLSIFFSKKKINNQLLNFVFNVSSFSTFLLKSY